MNQSIREHDNLSTIVAHDCLAHARASIERGEYERAFEYMYYLRGALPRLFPFPINQKNTEAMRKYHEFGQDLLTEVEPISILINNLLAKLGVSTK